MRLLLLRAAILSCVLVGPLSAPPAAAEKVLRYAFLVAETGFDPVQINDVYSSIIISNMFDAPLNYDYLARPSKVKPNLSAARREASLSASHFHSRRR